MKFLLIQIVKYLVAAILCLGTGCGDANSIDTDDIPPSFSEMDAAKDNSNKEPAVSVKTDKGTYAVGEAITITIRVENPYNEPIKILQGCGIIKYLIDNEVMMKTSCMAIPSESILAPKKYNEYISVHKQDWKKLSEGQHAVSGQYWTGNKKIISTPVTITIGNPEPGPGTGNANGIPVVFIHGHGNDVWAWQPMIKKIKGDSYIYKDGDGIYASDAEKLQAGTYPKNSIWNFGYYKESTANKEQYPYSGKIGGIPIDRTIIQYKIKSVNYYTDYAGCKKLSFFGECDPNNPTEVKDGGYASAVSYAVQLKRAVDGILKATGATKVNIVAHSMGGLVTRSYIKWLGGDTKVNKLLMVGTPNNGITDLGEHILQYGLILWLVQFINPAWVIQPDDILWMRLNEDMEMYPKNKDEYHFDKVQNKIPLFNGESWLYHLNSGTMIPSNVKYATVAGNYNKIKSQLILDLANAWFSTFSKFDIFPPDDGVVNVKEVQIPGAEFNKVVSAAHGRQGPNQGMGDINDPEKFLTENSETAKTIAGWIFQKDASQISVSSGKTFIEMVLDNTDTLSGWSNISNDLDVVNLSPDHIEGNYSVHFGGVDEGGTWVGQLGKDIPKYNWYKASAVKLWLKRGPTFRGGYPSLTFRIVDKLGQALELHRDEDVYLNWSGGGWRTVVDNAIWQEYVFPVKPEQYKYILWNDIKSLKIELRKTVYPNGKKDLEPDDVYMDNLRLVVEWADQDGDNVHDDMDNCPQKPNPDQYDGNDNGIGDACEPNVPKSFDTLLEDAEDISDWAGFGSGLKNFALSNDAVEGKHSMIMSGLDAGGTWVGMIEKKIAVKDWTKAPNIKFWAKRGSNVAGKGSPSLTFIAIDGAGKEVVLFKSNDINLPWKGGGWRTIISNTKWQEYLLPIKPADVNYADIQKIRIEMRRTVYEVGGAWPQDMEPDDVYIDNLRLDPYESDQNAVFSDKDEDGVMDGQDNCPGVFNPQQADWNQNGVGDGCEISPPAEVIVQPPTIAGVPNVPPLAIPIYYVKTLDQNTVITSKVGVVSVKMYCEEGTVIKSVPAFEPIMANVYSFRLQIGPLSETDTCHVLATDKSDQSTLASFQVYPVQ